MFRASFELRMMMLSSTRVLNSPSLYLTPKAVVEIGSYGIHQSESLSLPDIWLQSGRIVDVLGYRPNIPKVVRVEYHRA